MSAVTAQKVCSLGCPVGNLWDVYVDAVRTARYSYHGDKLVRIRVYDQARADTVRLSQAGAAIDQLYS